MWDIFKKKKQKKIYVKTKNTWYWRPWCVIRGWNIFFGRGTFVSVSEKKEEKYLIWINKFRTFLFVFDSHIGIILILYVVVYANCKNTCRNVLETWQWYNFNKKFTYLVGNKKYQKVLEKSLEKWSRYAKTIFWLHSKIKLA